MAYYTKVLQDGERVTYAGKLHWIVHQRAILSGLITVVAAFVWATRPEFGGAPGMALVLGLLVLTGGFYFGSWFKRITTEIVVTDRRIIHKTGWISRRTEEINITKVETVDVTQGFAGRILDYGTVGIKGIGGSWEPLRNIDSPLALRNAILVG